MLFWQYMGTETRRHRRHNQPATIPSLPPRPERPHAAHPTSSSSSSYTFQRPSESNTFSSLNTFNNTPTNNTFNSNNNSNPFNTFSNNTLNLPVNASNNNNQSNNLDFQNPNLLFGALLEEDSSVETVEEYGPSRSGPGPTRPSLLHPLMPRDLRHSARREFNIVSLSRFLIFFPVMVMLWFQWISL